MMPSLRVVGASAGEEVPAAAATAAASTASSSAASPPSKGGAARACGLPCAVPPAADIVGTAGGSSAADGDRKRPASVVFDSTRPILDAAAATTVAISPAATYATATADQSSNPLTAADSIRRGPPKKRICSDLASGACISAESALSAQAVAAAASTSAGRAMLGNVSDMRDLVNAPLGVTAIPHIQGIQRQGNFQLAPSSVSAAAAKRHYFPNGRLDSLDPPPTPMGNAIPGLSLPFPISSSTPALASHLSLLYRQQQLGYPATTCDQNVFRGMSIATALAEIEARELALARALAHQDVVSTTLRSYHAQLLSRQGQIDGLLREGSQPLAWGATEGADDDQRYGAPTKSQDEVQVTDQSFAKASTGNIHRKSVRTGKSCSDGAALPNGSETSDVEGMSLNKAESTKADEPPPTAAPKGRKQPKKISKKVEANGSGGAVAPGPKDTPRAIRPRVVATQSIFPETNTNSILLSHPDDSDLLSPYLCIIRKQIEVFVSTPEDIGAKLSVGGNKIPPVVGQIGLRCIYCKHIPFRDRAKSSESYPNLLKNIHQSVRNYQRHHWPKCKEIPDEVRKEVSACLGNKGSKSKGNAGRWWISSCRDRGLFDAEEVEFLEESKRCGIFLVDANDGIQPERHSNQKNEEGCGEKEETANRRRNSPISIPNTTVKSSPATEGPPRSGLDALLAAIVSVPTAPPAEATGVLPTPTIGTVASSRHEYIQPLQQSAQALSPDTHIHPKVWFTQNMVRMLGGTSSREIIDLEGANIVVRQSSRLQNELLPIFFGANFTLAAFETHLVSLGFRASFCSNDKKVFSMTEANADIKKSTYSE